MNLASNSETDGKKSKLFLDTLKDKEKFKEQILNTIYEQLRKAKREEVKKAVDNRYEKLKESASVRRHIPSIIEGQIKSEFRRKRKKV